MPAIGVGPAVIHGNHSRLIEVQAGGNFGLKEVAGIAHAGLGRVTGHGKKTWQHSKEGNTIVPAAARQGDKVINRQGSFIREELDNQIAFGGVERGDILFERVDHPGRAVAELLRGERLHADHRVEAGEIGQPGIRRAAIDEHERRYHRLGGSGLERLFETVCHRFPIKIGLEFGRIHPQAG